MKYFAAVCFCLSLGIGCASGSTVLSAKGEPVVRPQFADIAVPAGFEFLRDLSDKHEWEWKRIRFGRLVYRGILTIEETQDFFRKKMVAAGANWRETGFSSGGESLISFEKGSGENRESCQVRIAKEEKFTIVRISLDPIAGK